MLVYLYIRVFFLNIHRYLSYLYEASGSLHQAISFVGEIIIDWIHLEQFTPSCGLLKHQIREALTS